MAERQFHCGWEVTVIRRSIGMIRQYPGREKNSVTSVLKGKLTELDLKGSLPYVWLVRPGPRRDFCKADRESYLEIPYFLTSNFKIRRDDKDAAQAAADCSSWSLDSLVLGALHPLSNRISLPPCLCRDKNIRRSWYAHQLFL